jgi:hypothetical protein
MPFLDCNDGRPGIVCFAALALLALFAIGAVGCIARRPGAVAENVAVGFPNKSLVLGAWMNSPGHRANTLNPAYTQVGTGFGAGAGGTLQLDSGLRTRRLLLTVDQARKRCANASTAARPPAGHPHTR